MKRRSPIALLALAAATLAGGCTTFSDSDAAARVGDVEFTQDELVAQLEELGATPEELAQADIARGQVSAWVADQVADGVYAEGLLASGSICLEVIAVESLADAEESVTALESGTAFGEVFAAGNIDPSLAETGGRIGCLALAELDTAGGNPLVDSITDLTAANQFAIAVLPGETAATDLYVVSRFIPYDELGPDETPVVAAGIDAEGLGLDIYINPRIGTYDNASGTVIPLG